MKRNFGMIVVAAALAIGTPAFAQSPASMSAPQPITERDVAHAFDWTRFSAEQGQDWAQYMLANMYSEGIGTAQNDALAAHWMRLAAGQGLPEAKARLGLFLVKGKGTPQNFDEARQLFESAADVNGDAAFNRGWMALTGLGESNDPVTALAWFLKAAKFNQPEAITQIGNLFALGQAVEKDSAEAIAWWSRGARLGDANAAMSLGAAYERGIGAPANIDSAVAWYTSAGNNYLTKGDAQGAQRALAAITTLNPESLAAQALSGAIRNAAKPVASAG